jgi:hypothetical protein
MRMILWVLSVGGALGAAYGLYLLEHEVKTMERSLARLDDATRRDTEAVQVLQAEWSYLNRPERLQELSTRHLNLTPSALSQIATAPSMLAALPVAATRTTDSESTEPLPVSAIPVPAPKPLAPRRAVVPPASAPLAPQIVQALRPAQKIAPVAAVAVPATFRIDDIRIGGTR